MQTVFITVGIPASGKSSYFARQKDWTAWGLSEAPVYISSDEARKELFGDATEQSNAKLVFMVLINLLTMALGEGHSVYLDATHIQRSWREDAIRAAKSFGVRVVALDFDVSLDAATKHDNSRSRKVGLDVLQRYLSIKEAPTVAEGFDSVTTITVTD